jgi:tetratricopeptide (TPR) repeat protein
MQNGFVETRAAARLVAALVFFVVSAGLTGCASDPLLRGGVTHFDAGRYEEAAGVFEQAVARVPNDAEAHLWLARSYSELGRIEDAAREYGRAGNLNPSLAPQIDSNRRRYWVSWQARGETILGEALGMKGGSARDERLDQAATAFRNAGLLAPERALTEYQLSRLHEARGENSLADQALARAFEKARADRDAIPVLLPIVKEEGRKAVNEDRYADAIAAFETALALSPEDPDLMLDLATARLLGAEERRASGETEGYRKAADLLEQVRKVRPNDADVLYNLATVRYRLGQVASADSMIHRYLLLKPADPDGYDLLAELARAADRTDQARTASLAARVLALKRPVGDPADWVRRAAEKFGSGSDLGRLHSSLGVPDEVHTLKEKSTLLEVWFYFEKGRVAAFENGAAAGPALDFRKSSL